MIKRRMDEHDDADELNEEDTDNAETEQDPEAVDPDVKDIFEQAQELDYGRDDLTRKLESYTDRTPELTGGDVDASWEYADVGEETVGGQNPTPDQSVVDEEGEAVGLTYQDNEPLAVDDKVGERDREPWELNPASTPEYSERVREEFHEPLETLGITPEPAEQEQMPEQKGKAKPARSRRQNNTRERSSSRALSAKSTTHGTKSAKGRSAPARSAKGGTRRKSVSRRSIHSRARGVRK